MPTRALVSPPYVMLSAAKHLHLPDENMEPSPERRLRTSVRRLLRPAGSQCQNAVCRASGLNQVSNSPGAAANPSLATKPHQRSLHDLRRLHAIDLDKQPFGEVVANQR